MGSVWIAEESAIPAGFITVPLVTASGIISNPIPGFVLIRPETFEERIERESREEVDKIAPGWSD